MRVILDTNVLVSAALKDSSFPTLALHMAVLHGTLLKCTATERQLFEVLARPRITALIEQTAVDLMRTVMAAAEAVAITEHIAACRDATDGKFLELAVNGKADVIVSGGADLLALNPFRGLPIVPPAFFVRQLPAFSSRSCGAVIASRRRQRGDRGPRQRQLAWIATAVPTRKHVGGARPRAYQGGRVSRYVHAGRLISYQQSRGCPASPGMTDGASGEVSEKAGQLYPQ